VGPRAGLDRCDDDDGDDDNNNVYGRLRPLDDM
jgi:hypothetical protein